MNIHILFIPHTEQRYDTFGDWRYDEAGDLVISISNDVPENPTPESQQLVALHELVEVLLCKQHGVTQKQVDDFDFAHESTIDEPGDLPDAPYRKEHRQAMIIEHLMANFMGLINYGRIE